MDLRCPYRRIRRRRPAVEIARGLRISKARKKFRRLCRDFRIEDSSRSQFFRDIRLLGPSIFRSERASPIAKSSWILGIDACESPERFNPTLFVATLFHRCYGASKCGRIERRMLQHLWPNLLELTAIRRAQ